MSPQRAEFVRELIRGTELVSEAAAGSLALADFLARYDSFFYFNSLDGHEKTATHTRFLSEFSKVCALHRAIQVEVVDRLYSGERRAEFEKAGRLWIDDAAPRIREIAREHADGELLAELRQALKVLASRRGAHPCVRGTQAVAAQRLKSRNSGSQRPRSPHLRRLPCATCCPCSCSRAPLPTGIR